MCRVLIVDDEEIFRIQIQEALAADGHSIATAGSGRDAIDTAIRFRPDVLVVDWMLKDHMHGLHVVDTVRTVVAGVRPIMVTGFGSDELRESAERHGVFDFVEKPFERATIQRLVLEAADSPPMAVLDSSIAVLVLDSAGKIVFSNNSANRLFGIALDGRQHDSLNDLFGDGLPDLEAASKDWVVVRPLADRPTFWYVRTQQPQSDGLRIMVIRPQSDPQYIGGAIVGMLLGATHSVHTAWPFAGRVLVIDREPVVRRMAMSMLDSVGATCYAASSLDEACRLLANDDGLHFVVFDYSFDDTPAAQAIERMRSVRPDLLIIGTGDGEYQAAFHALGVSAYIQKPWHTQGLIEAIDHVQD